VYLVAIHCNITRRQLLAQLKLFLKISLPEIFQVSGSGSGKIPEIFQVSGSGTGTGILPEPEPVT